MSFGDGGGVTDPRLARSLYIVKDDLELLSLLLLPPNVLGLEACTTMSSLGGVGD